MRWSLSPFLVIFALVFFIHIPELLENQRYDGVLAISVMIILCLAGLLALWGVPLMGRIVTAIIASFCVWCVVDQCIFKFDGNWGWGGRKSSASPIGCILAFLVFGWPCLIYTILGRFSLRKDPDYNEVSNVTDDLDDAEIEECDQGDRDDRTNGDTRSV